MKALPRIFFRLASGIAAFLLVAFAVLVLWMRYWALPHVDQYRADIVAAIDKASGMTTSVKALRGGWDGLPRCVPDDDFDADAEMARWVADLEAGRHPLQTSR